MVIDGSPAGMARCPIAPDSSFGGGCENIVRKFLSLTRGRIAAVWGNPPYRLMMQFGKDDSINPQPNVVTNPDGAGRRPYRLVLACPYDLLPTIN